MAHKYSNPNSIRKVFGLAFLGGLTFVASISSVVLKTTVSKATTFDFDEDTRPNLEHLTDPELEDLFKNPTEGAHKFKIRRPSKRPDEQPYVIAPPKEFLEAKDKSLFKHADLLVANGEENSFYTRVGQQNVYDLASLTKPFAVASLFAVLWSQGLISPDQKVTTVLPRFVRFSNVTFRQLLTHTSGLPADVDLKNVEPTFESFLQRMTYIRDHVPLALPHERTFVYSDVGYQVLGYALEKVAKMKLNQAVTEFVYRPLGIEREIGFFAGNGTIPHDPRARKYFPRAMGHAGLFATANAIKTLVMFYFNAAYNSKAVSPSIKISKWARTKAGLRRRLRSTNTPLLREEVARQMLQPVTSGRGFAFDFTSDYSKKPRGDCYKVGESFGHTGFVGTSVWIEPGKPGPELLKPRMIIFLSDSMAVKETPETELSIRNLRYVLASWACTQFPRSMLFGKNQESETQPSNEEALVKN